MPPKSNPEVSLSYTVDARSGCWLWTGTVVKVGYGQIHIWRRKLYAHRYSYEQAYGVGIPAGWHVHHRCGNRLCIRPEHLECLPPREHVRQHSTVPDEKIAAMRALRGRMSNRQIAERFGVHEAYVSRLLLGRFRTPDGNDVPAPPKIYVLDAVPLMTQEEIVTLYGQGVSQRRIAVMLSIPRDRVRAILRHRKLAA